MTETPKDATGKETVLTGFSGDGAVALAQPTTADTAARGSLRWLPGPKVLQEYRREWLNQDVFAGLVLTAVLVPVGMAYAEAAGLPPIAGLYATLVPLIAYALFGPSRILVLGPDSSLAGIVARWCCRWLPGIRHGGSPSPGCSRSSRVQTLRAEGARSVGRRCWRDARRRSF